MASMVGESAGPKTNLLVQIFLGRSAQVKRGGTFPCGNRPAVRGFEAGGFQKAQNADGGNRILILDHVFSSLPEKIRDVEKETSDEEVLMHLKCGRFGSDIWIGELANADFVR